MILIERKLTSFIAALLYQIRFKVISKYCLAVLRIAFIQSIFSKEKGKNRRFSKWGCFVHLYGNLALYAIFQG